MSAVTPAIDLTGDPNRHRREWLVRAGLRTAATVSIFISVAIVLSLVVKATAFIGSLDTISQLWDSSGWRPSGMAFDVRTIFLGSLIISSTAMLVAVPLGLGAAIYLSEYAKPRVRRLLKPIIEILAGVPSVVLGFFALTFITPNVVKPLFNDANQFNLLAAGLAVGVLVSPLMTSITEDALRAVPHALREAAFGLGARKRLTTLRVVLPAAISGIVAGFIITISRAIGETMVVTIAAGGSGSAPFTSNPLDPSLTMTSAIANLATGSDAPTVGDPFLSLYFVGLLLFIVTLGLNVIGDRIVRRHRKAY